MECLLSDWLVDSTVQQLTTLVCLYYRNPWTGHNSGTCAHETFGTAQAPVSKRQVRLTCRRLEKGKRCVSLLSESLVTGLRRRVYRTL